MYEHTLFDTYDDNINDDIIETDELCRYDNGFGLSLPNCAIIASKIDAYIL